MFKSTTAIQMKTINQKKQPLHETLALYLFGVLPFKDMSFDK